VCFLLEKKKGRKAVNNNEVYHICVGKRHRAAVLILSEI
jgi:hypothetical protein